MMREEIPVSRPANDSAAENAQQQPEAPKDTKVAFNLAFLLASRRKRAIRTT